MKKTQLFALAAAALLTASCSDSDEPANRAAEIAGTYTGYTIARSAYFDDMAAADQNVTLTALPSDKVALQFVSSTWGTVAIPAMTVVESGGAYVLEGSGTSSMAMQSSAVKEYTCDATGRIAGEEASFTFTCPQIMGGLTIEFHSGDTPAQPDAQ